MKYKGLILLFGGLFFGVLLGVLVAAGGPQAGSTTGNRTLPPTVGSPVEQFQLDTLDNAPVAMSDLQGKPVVLNFWATWCAPCKEEMPLLERYSVEYADSLVVMGVNSGESKDVVQKYVQEQKITFPILLDRAAIVTDLYYVRNFPITFFIDAEGVLRAQHIGLLSDELIQKYLNLIGVVE